MEKEENISQPPVEEKAEEVAEEPKEETPKEPEANEASDAPDYKALLEKETKRTEQVQYNLDKFKAENAKLKKAQDEDDFGDEVTPDVSAIVQEEVKKQTASITRESQRHVARSIAGQLASNDDEKALIMHHYEHSVSPSGDVEIDIKRARAIANEGTISAERDEALEALRTQDLKSRGGGSGSKPKTETARPKLSPQDAKMLADFKWNPEKERYEGKRFAMRVVNGELVQETM